MSEETPRDTGHSSGIAAMMAKGGIWMVLARLILRTIGLVSTVILARILVPEDFGLVALAASFVGMLDAVSEFSFSAALIRDQKAGRDHYDTAWTLTIFRQTLLAAILVASAGYAASFFGDPRIEPIIYVLAAITLLDAATNIGVVDLAKRFRFDKQFWFMFVPKLVAFFVTIILAYLWRSYWALLAGIVTARVVMVAFSYVIHPYRPRLSLRRAHELVHFSKWLLLNNALIFINRELDTFIIGRLLGVKTVGLYNIAKEVALLPTTELVWPLMQVVLSGFSKIGHDRRQLATAYLDTLGIIWLVGAPAGIGIALVADLAVTVMLGDKWLDAIPLMEILAVGGAVRVLAAASGQVYLVVGRPNLVAWLAAFNLVIFASATYLLVFEYGTIGVAYAFLATMAISVVVNLALCARILAVSTWETCERLWRPFLAATVMAAAVYGLRSVWIAEPRFGDQLTLLAGTAAFGAAVYLGVELLLWRMTGRPTGAEERLLGLVGLRWGGFFLRLANKRVSG